MADGEKAALLDLSSVKANAEEMPGPRNKDNTSSHERTVVNLTKCFIGAASLELPWAFMQAGLLGSLVGVAILATLSSFSLCRLALSGQLVLASNERRGDSTFGGVLTFPELGMVACGPWGKRAAWFGTFAMTLGACGSYFVFISSTMQSLTSFSFDFWIFCVTMPITIALSCLPSLKYLAPTSLLGICALVISVLFVVIDGCSHTTVFGMIITLCSLPMVRVSTFPLFLGNAGFLYLIGTAVLPVAQNMKNPSKFGEAFNSSIIFVTVLNVAFGFVALAAYGDCTEDGQTCTQQNITDNLHPGFLSTCVKVALCVDLIFTGVLFLVPLSEALEREFGIDDGDSKRYIIRAAVPCAIAVVAKIIPFFSLLTGLSGGFGGNLLGFILPPLFYYEIRSQEGHWSYSECGGQRPWKLLLFRPKECKDDSDDEGCARRHRNRGRLLEEIALAGTFAFGISFLVMTIVFFGREIANANE
jgi:amino acid permease